MGRRRRKEEVNDLGRGKRERERGAKGGRS